MARALYIHWPFCLRKCPYCDFNSHVRDAVDPAQWREALLADIRHEAALAPQDALSAQGGTVPAPEVRSGIRACQGAAPVGQPETAIPLAVDDAPSLRPREEVAKGQAHFFVAPAVYRGVRSQIASVGLFARWLTGE